MIIKPAYVWCVVFLDQPQFSATLLKSNVANNTYYTVLISYQVQSCCTVYIPLAKLIQHVQIVTIIIISTMYIELLERTG